MTAKRVSCLVIGMCLLLGFSAADSTAQSATDRPNGAIVAGRVSGDPVKTLPRLQAMADYLAGKLAQFGVTSGDAIVVSSNDEMVELLRAGRVDILSETVMSALHFAEAAGAELLLREWKKGVTSYRSVFITRVDSGISDLDALRGRVVAFEDPGSTSAFLVPFAMLRQLGLDLVELSGPNQAPPPNKVGYVFTGGEINIAVWVARGLAQAGAFSDLDWEDAQRTPEVIKANLRLLHTGEPMVRSVILARGDLDPSLKAAIRDILTRMHTDPAAKPVLKKYYKVKRYDELAGDVTRSLDEARALYALVSDRMQ